MFSEPGAIDRLKMCEDCRVIDMFWRERSRKISKNCVISNKARKLFC